MLKSIKLKNSQDSIEKDGSILLLENHMEILTNGRKGKEQWGNFTKRIIDDFIIPNISKHSTPEDILKLLNKYNIEDVGWDWESKSFKLYGNNYYWFIVEICDEIQGFSIIYYPKQSKLTNKDIFYIDFFATAPWNRDSPINEKIYTGVGSLLLKVSSNYLINELKYEPGLCLHSLKGSEDYYKKIGMIDLGIDTQKENLKYFEMDSTNLLSFIS